VNPIRAFWKDVILIFAGKYTQYGDPRIVSNKIKKERNGDVEIYAITIGEEKHSSGFDVMKRIASDIEGQQHFFWFDSQAIKAIANDMTSPGSCFIFVYSY